MNALQWIVSQPPVLRFKQIIVENDYIIYEWFPVKQYSLSFTDKKVPFIQEYRIDYKNSNDGIKWNHTICTNSSKINRIIFYKLKLDSVGDYITIPKSYSDDNNTRHEYGIFKDNTEIDIRIYGVNYADTPYNYLTHTKLSFYNFANIKKISGVRSDKSNDTDKYYIINGEEMNNYIAIGFMNGHIFFKPFDKLMIDGYRYENNKWIDYKLLDTIKLLIENKQCNDTIFLILEYDFIDRVLGNDVNERTKNLKTILKEIKSD
jgi:hypothetical protein